MPLPKRVVSPVHVSRDTLPAQVHLVNDLEGVTNGTLANIIRQLSGLSKHAEDLFGEMSREADNLHQRSLNLQARIDRLAVKVTQLDSAVEEVSLQDILLRKAFRSNSSFDQKVVTKDSLPVALVETYRQCDMPPPLDKLNVYRDDGKDGLKFYTDPNYFFDLWKQEMVKDTERILQDRGKKPHRIRSEGSGGGNRQRKRVRQPHNTRERHRQIAITHGEYITPQSNVYQPQKDVIYLEDGTVLPDPNPSSVVGRPAPPWPNSIELKSSHGPGFFPEDLYGTRNPNPRSSTNSQYSSTGRMGVASGAPPPYDDGYPQYPPPPYSMDPGHAPAAFAGSSHYAPGLAGAAAGGGANSRTLQRTTSGRPTQPPPAPPGVSPSISTVSIGGGGGGGGASTPTRARSIVVRESLPPPPPPPSVDPQPLLRTNNTVISPIMGRAGTTYITPPYISSVTVNSTAPLTSTPLPPPPPLPVSLTDSVLDPELPPPPTPPPPLEFSQASSSSGGGGPPPPPPPPPPMPTNGILSSPAKSPVANGEAKGVAVSSPKGSPGRYVDEHASPATPPQLAKPAGPKALNVPAHAMDARSDLLKAIRDGISLRKVEIGQQREVEKSRIDGLHDVASILARRVAMEISDSESGSDPDSGSDWDDETSA